MRLVKHNALENFKQFSIPEKQDLLIQEMSKAFMLFPQATADVFELSGVTIKSQSAQSFVEALEKNPKNLKLINKIVRLSFLVNQSGDQNMRGHNRSISFRNLMRQGSVFLKKNQENMKQATLITRDLMTEKAFSKMLGKSVNYYLNMDGETSSIPSKKMDKPNSSFTNHVIKTNIIVWAVIIGIGVITYKVLKNK